MTTMASVNTVTSHQRILGMLFEHPMSHNIEWRQVVHLLESLGTAVEGSHDSLHVTVNNEAIVLHRPKHKDLSEEQIVQIRHFLVRAGVQAPHPTKGPNSDPAPA
jgi:hypothetical protein